MASRSLCACPGSSWDKASADEQAADGLAAVQNAQALDEILDGEVLGPPAVHGVQHRVFSDGCGV